MSTPVAESHLRQLARVLRRRWKMMAVSCVVGAALAGAAGLLIPPRYTAKAQIILDPKKGSSAGSPTIVEGGHDEAAVETQVAMLISEGRLQQVLDSFQAERSGEPTEIQNQYIPQVDTLDLEKLGRNLRAFPERRSRVIGITFTSTSPALSAAVANRTAQLHVMAIAERNGADRQYALRSLAERLPLARAQVERTEAALQTYRGIHGFTDVNQPDMADQQLVDLNRQLALAYSDLAARRGRMKALNELQPRHDALPILIEALDDPSLRALYRAHEPALRSGTAVAALSLPEQPTVQAVSANPQDIRAIIGQSIAQAISQLTSETTTIETRVRALQQRLTTLQNASTHVRESEVQIRELKRDAASAAQVYESILQRQKDMILDRDGPPDVRVLFSAAIPELPSSPHPALFIFPAVLAAFLGAGFLAVLLDSLDDRLRGDRDVADALGIPCIGIIPQLSSHGRRHPWQHLIRDPLSPYAEAVRSMVAVALDLSNQRDPPKVFLVTSSVPREGKTTLACSFAVYAAVLQWRVILIDLDCRRSSSMKEQGRKADGGDPEARQALSVNSIRTVPELGIDYIAAASSPVEPIAMIADGRLAELLNALRGDYDCIVIDGAPLLGSTQARLLASMVDHVLFAIKWGSSRRQIAQNALKSLRCAGDQMGAFGVRVSAVITQTNLKKHARYGFGDLGEGLLRARAAR